MDPYAALDLPADADDAAIRRRYLELVREFPPDHHPETMLQPRISLVERPKPTMKLIIPTMKSFRLTSTIGI